MNFSAIPPPASRYSERKTLAKKPVLISPKRPFLIGSSWRKAANGQTAMSAECHEQTSADA